MGTDATFRHVCSELEGTSSGRPLLRLRAIAFARRPCYGAPHASSQGMFSMPILIFIVLVILIAQVGFWDTFSAILGGVAMIVLFALLAIALAVLAGILLVRRLR
jgi:hypothetical protein